MTEQPYIRTASTDDTELLAALAARTFRDAFAGANTAEDLQSYIDESFSVERVGAELANTGNTFLLAFLDGADAPSGYAKLRSGTTDGSVKGPDPLELERIYVDQAAIGRGVGAALMRATLDTARHGGYRTLWLGVWERNRPAIAFYKRFEFTVVGEHPFRLGSDMQTDLVMSRPVKEES